MDHGTFGGLTAYWRRGRAALARRLRRRGAPSPPAAPSQVFAVALDSDRPVSGTLVRATPAGDYSQAAISPDGRRVVCWGGRPGVPGYQLYVTDLDTLVCRQHTDVPGLNGHPAWMPDGSAIVYFSSYGVSEEWEWRRDRQFSPDRTPVNLFRLHLESGTRTQLTFGPWVDERPAVSPDGRRVVFVSNRSGRLNLWVVEEGGELKQLTAGPVRDYRPQFSPDGSRIVYFTSRTEGGGDHLAMVSWPDAEPMTIRPRPDFDWVHGPYWSADGELLLIHALLHGERRPSLWIMHVTSGECDRLNIEGVPDSSHGSWDAARRRLTFDTRTELGLPETPLVSG